MRVTPSGETLEIRDQSNPVNLPGSAPPPHPDGFRGLASRVRGFPFLSPPTSPRLRSPEGRCCGSGTRARASAGPRASARRGEDAPPGAAGLVSEPPLTDGARGTRGERGTRLKVLGFLSVFSPCPNPCSEISLALSVMSPGFSSLNPSAPHALLYF